jgi:3-hydroxyacyl-CoA dehydrogenase
MTDHSEGAVAMPDVVTLALDGEIAVLTVDNPPVNALSAAVRKGLQDGLRQAIADPQAKALVILCAGRTFIAGADITEFGKPPQPPHLPDLCTEIEDCPKPVVAAIHGTALGGGLEVALGCHFRVAVPSARVGLPEVKLGLLPGAGGTQRLPRLVGVPAALQAITSGAQIDAGMAAMGGLIDELLTEGQLREGAVAFARKVLAEGRPVRKTREQDGKIAEARGKPEIFAEFRKANARRMKGFEAPEACIQAIEAAVNLPFDQGMKVERDLFARLVSGDQSAAQRHIFFAERQTARIPDIDPKTPIADIRKVGVIGAGTMGGGISMNFLNVGVPVTIVETQQAALDRGLGVIRKNYENTAKRGRITAQDVETRMSLLSSALDLSSLADCDLIIEAVFENMDIKKDVFTRLDKIAKPGAILASNTSYLDVNEIAAVTSRPEQVLGMHFFSPANVMKLLEVVRGAKTAKPVVATAMAVGKKVGKVPVLVGVCHGFVGNRMLEQRQQQANALVLEGAMPWDVDKVLVEFGMPMGPFQMADLAGLDIGWSKESNKSESLRDKLCELDRRGQKTGAGVYDYDEARNPQPSPITEKIVLELSAQKGFTRRAIGEQEILERCVYPMINEGAKILEEGIAVRASDIDVVWVYGYGWPVYRGGPMFYADLVGLPKIAERLAHYSLEPAALLRKLAAAGKGFASLDTEKSAAA